MLIFLTFLGVALLTAPTSGFLCSTDEAIDNKQDFEFDIPHPANDIVYWRNHHLFYYLFGEFKEEPSQEVVTAIYQDLEGNPIFEAKISCSAGTWTTRYMKDGALKTWKTGDLVVGVCKKGIFDLIFKVEQARFMKFIFNGQALDHTPIIGEMYRKRPKPIDGDENARNAGSLAVTVTESAVFTRFAFGKCMAWPLSITKCPEAKAWIGQRGKLNSTKNGGSGTFGAYNNKFTVSCLADSDYFMWVMEGIHPNRESEDTQCCCTDMLTGRIYNKDTHCQVVGEKVCELNCPETYRADIALNYLDAMGSTDKAKEEKEKQ